MINGRRHYLWRAVDQDGDTLDILLQSRRNQLAAERFFRKLLKGDGASPCLLVTDKLPSRSAAHHHVFCAACHRAACQQPRGGIASADPCAQASDAGFQVTGSGAALPGRVCRDRASVPIGQAPAPRSSLPPVSVAGLLVLAAGHVHRLNQDTV